MINVDHSVSVNCYINQCFLSILVLDTIAKIINATFTAADDSEFPDDAKVTEVKDNFVTIKGGNGFELQLDFPNAASATTTTYTDLAVDLTCIGDSHKVLEGGRIHRKCNNHIVFASSFKLA